MRELPEQEDLMPYFLLSVAVLLPDLWKRFREWQRLQATEGGIGNG